MPTLPLQAPNPSQPWHPKTENPSARKPPSRSCTSPNPLICPAPCLGFHPHPQRIPILNAAPLPCCPRGPLDPRAQQPFKPSILSHPDVHSPTPKMIGQASGLIWTCSEPQPGTHPLDTSCSDTPKLTPSTPSPLQQAAAAKLNTKVRMQGRSLSWAGGSQIHSSFKGRGNQSFLPGVRTGVRATAAISAARQAISCVRGLV